MTAWSPSTSAGHLAIPRVPALNLKGGSVVSQQPIIFDLVNKVVLQVGRDPEADRRYAELVSAQQQTLTTASGVPKPE